MLDSPVLLGIGIPLINFLISILLVYIGLKMRLKELFKIVLIGFVVRYLFISGLIFYLFTQFNRDSSGKFGIYFLVSVFFFIMSEIIIFHYGANFVFLRIKKSNKKSR